MIIDFQIGKNHIWTFVFYQVFITWSRHVETRPLRLCLCMCVRASIPYRATQADVQWTDGLLLLSNAGRCLSAALHSLQPASRRSDRTIKSAASSLAPDAIVRRATHNFFYLKLESKQAQWDVVRSKKSAGNSSASSAYRTRTFSLRQ